MSFLDSLLVSYVGLSKDIRIKVRTIQCEMIKEVVDNFDDFLCVYVFDFIIFLLYIFFIFEDYFLFDSNFKVIDGALVYFFNIVFDY